MLADPAAFGLPVQSMEAICAVLARQPRVQRADIYGSRAKGNFRTGSDIDITLVGDELTLGDLLKIEGEIDDLDLPYSVDLSLFAQIENPALRSHIERIGQAIYRAPTSQVIA